MKSDRDFCATKDLDLVFNVGEKVKVDRVSLVAETSENFYREYDPTSYEVDTEREEIHVTLPKISNDEFIVNINANTTFGSDKDQLGVFHPFNGRLFAHFTKNPGIVVTQFEDKYARTVFPCLDDPHFQSIFQFSIQIPKDTAPKIDIVLFNTPLERYDESSRTYVFQRTKNPIPAYLLSFALLDSNRYNTTVEMDYFGTPIRFIQYMDRSFIVEVVNNVDLVKSAVRYTLAFCEQLFKSKFDWPKLDFVFTEHAWGGMEHPGLITIEQQQGITFAINAIVHEIIHQWTGVKMLND